MKKIKLSQSKINALFAILTAAYLCCALAIIGTYGASFAIIERIQELESESKDKIFEPFDPTISGAGLQGRGAGLAGADEGEK